MSDIFGFTITLIVARVNTSSNPEFRSTTIQDYCILGTNIVAFYGFGYLLSLFCK